MRHVWLWGEGLWLDAFFDNVDVEEDCRAGGRKKSNKASWS